MLKLFGWKLDIMSDLPDKCVICVAPHTSNWDFILGMAAYKSLGRKFNFLIKESWFFFPMNLIFKALGGIPVPAQKGKGDLTNHIIETFKLRDYLNLAITPEGTRSLQSKWRTGFLYIAYGAKVPILLGVIDYKTKIIVIRNVFQPTGDVDHDMKAVKDYYRSFMDAALYTNKFTVD